MCYVMLLLLTFIIARILTCNAECVLSFLSINEYDDDDESHMRIRFVPTSMTLDDLEPFVSIYTCLYRAHHKMNEDRPILFATKMYANDSSV